jgi:hypothetical protein
VLVLSVEVFDQLEVNIDTKEVLRFLGYRDAKKPEAKVHKILADEIEEARVIVRPKAIYCEVNVLGTGNDSIELDGNLMLRVGEKAVRWWYGCQSLAVALCTIGGGLEEKVLTLFGENKYTQALILDSAGSVAVDSVADQVNHFICHKALDSGMNVGPRLSPGYGKWPLTDQRLIFELLDGRSIGIHLNDHCMMIPQKSVSFCAGLGMQESLGKINPCRYCDMPDCQYRKVK